MRTSHEKHTTSGWRSVVRSPLFFLANLAIMLVIGASTVRETYRGWSSDREIHALEAQAAQMEGRKVQLQTLTQELASPDRVDIEARARLGRKKPDEHVIVIDGIATTGSWTDDARTSLQQVPAPAEPDRSNPEKWWHYFFHS